MCAVTGKTGERNGEALRTGKRYDNDEGAILDLGLEGEVFIARAIDPKAIAAKKTT